MIHFAQDLWFLLSIPLYTICIQTKCVFELVYQQCVKKCKLPLHTPHPPDVEGGHFLFMLVSHLLFYFVFWILCARRWCLRLFKSLFLIPLCFQWLDFPLFPSLMLAALMQQTLLYTSSRIMLICLLHRGGQRTRILGVHRVWYACR